MKNVWIKRIAVSVGMMIAVTAVFFAATEKTIAEVPPCVIGKCPKEIRVGDNGRVLTYRVGQKFNVVLDRFIYPPDDVRCGGDAVISRTLSLRDHYPNQMQRFVVGESGSCVLTAKDFSVTITAVAKEMKK